MSKQMHARAAGFSLVELLVVVAIIGMTITIATPRFFRAQQRHSLRIEVQTVQHLMTLARSRAIASRGFVAVEFELQTYPAPDLVRVLEDAEWDAATSRWTGTEMPGFAPHVIDGQLDLKQVKVGTTGYMTGFHSIVFAPSGAAGMDDGSILGSLDVEIVRMDATA